MNTRRGDGHEGASEELREPRVHAVEGVDRVELRLLARADCVVPVRVVGQDVRGGGDLAGGRGLERGDDHGDELRRGGRRGRRARSTRVRS